MNPRAEPKDGREDIGEIGLLWMLVVLGVLPMIFTVVRGEVWGVWPTLGLLMVVFSIWGLLRNAVERWRSRKS